MNKHLYQLKKPCPGTKIVIELTDEIKQHILDNRIYKIPEEPKAPTITNLFINRRTIRYTIISQIWILLRK
jgi:hypothetical protein